MRKHLYKLPYHLPENFPELIDEVKRRKNTLFHQPKKKVYQKLLLFVRVMGKS